VIAPLALIGLIGLPIIVAFYMLRLRRRDVPVGSTFLWQQLVRDVEANAPWQRLRFSWLLLVQLLIAALAVAAAVRPFTVADSDLASTVVLVVDTSASMGVASDDEDRMALARARARDVVARLPDGGRVTVVAAADTAEVLVSETDDRDAAVAAIDGIRATGRPGDLTDAFALAAALAARESDATVVVVTDAGEGRLPEVGIGAPVLVERVGETDANQAIAALSVVRRAGGAQLDLFVAVANPSTADATRRLEIVADGELVDARDLAVGAGERTEAIIGTVPAGARVVEARLAGADALAADDRAFAIVPPETVTRALVVGDGNPYLENALALLPRLELFAVGEAGYTDAVEEAAGAGEPYGLVVFDGVAPQAPPEAPTLYVDPPGDGPYGAVSGRIEVPQLERPDPDDPILRFVDLSTVHVGRARNVEPADGLRAVVATSAGAPLVAVGEVESGRIGLIAFDLRESDLPLQVAFPLLMSNLVEFLLPPGDGILPSSMSLADPVVATVDPAITAVRVTHDGSGEPTVSEHQVIGGELRLPPASVPGIRMVEAVSDDPELDGTELGATAVNLFAADESAIRPGDPMRIVDMGRVPADAEGGARQTRAEWWWALAAAALGLLALEWLLFHRPTRRALRRLTAGTTRRRPVPAGRPR
jgi:Ca-activated chloride channel homolog